MHNEKGPKSAPDFDFYKKLETFPQEIQDRIAALSSSLLEKDIYEKIKADKEAILGLAKEFKAQGVSEEDINGILTHFSLPLPEEDNGRSTETGTTL
jgi:hypothetical protein